MSWVSRVSRSLGELSEWGELNELGELSELGEWVVELVE